MERCVIASHDKQYNSSAGLGQLCSGLGMFM